MAMATAMPACKWLDQNKEERLPTDRLGQFLSVEMCRFEAFGDSRATPLQEAAGRHGHGT